MAIGDAKERLSKVRQVLEERTDIRGERKVAAQYQDQQPTQTLTLENQTTNPEEIPDTVDQETDTDPETSDDETAPSPKEGTEGLPEEDQAAADEAAREEEER